MFAALFLSAVDLYAYCMNSVVFQGQLWVYALLAAVLLILVGGVALAYRAGRRRGLLEAELSEGDRLEMARKDAVERSRAALSGQVSEQIAPWLPDFPVNPADARFVGKPVDFVAFSGADQGAVREIVFIEVKSGRSTLSQVERSVRDAILQGRVRWVEYRIE